MPLLDCVYYATVSLSTTGYGDITPLTPSARLVNVLVITPMRIAFLIVLIGTTVETLTTQDNGQHLRQRGVIVDHQDPWLHGLYVCTYCWSSR